MFFLHKGERKPTNRKREKERRRQGPDESTRVTDSARGGIPGLARAVLWDADPARPLERQAIKSSLRSRAVADDDSHVELCKEPWESSPMRREV